MRTVYQWAALLFCLNAICFAFMYLGKDLNVRSFASDLGGILIPSVACICCFGFKKTASYRRLSQVRFLPAMLGWSSLIYALGTIAYAYDTRILGKPGNPGLSDFFYLLQYPAFIAAIALWPARPVPAPMRWRAWSDAFVLVTTVFAFGWTYLIGPAVKDSDMSALGILIDTAYPVFDVLIIFSILQMMRKSLDARFRFATYLFVSALILNVLGDLYYALAQLGGEYHSGLWFDIAWPLTCALCSLAGLMVKNRMEVPGFREAAIDKRLMVSQRTWTLYAPYVMVPAVGLLIVSVGRSETDGLIKTGLYFCGLALGIAILVRQMIAIAENGNLYASLREAYDELEQKNLHISLTAEQASSMNERLKIMAEELEGQNKHLSETNEHLHLIATKDSMTGLANHRVFQERLRQEVARASRNNHGLALALIDVDFFKQYNDNYGHPAGDEVLRSIARMLEECTRAGDLAARYGGEEFALLLPFVNVEDAQTILERLRYAVSTFDFKHRRVTLSIGMCMYAADSNTPEALLEQADKALYSAKGRGRNQVVTQGDIANLSIACSDEKANFDTSTPMGYAATLAAALQYIPEALALESEGALVAGLLATLELKDPATRGDSTRVMWFAMRLAQASVNLGIANLSQNSIRSLGLGAVLHDLGRIGISEDVLKSSDSYDASMIREIQRHSKIGADLIGKFPGLTPAVPVILHHHERWNGSGYPYGLSAEEIPIEARILAYADAFNAMSTDRPYAVKRPYDEICGEFIGSAGGQFDPKLLDAFLSVPESEWDQLRAMDAFEHGARIRAA
jgi:diguanylate cyclase (GGDEF)-like protein